MLAVFTPISLWLQLKFHLLDEFFPVLDLQIPYLQQFIDLSEPLSLFLEYIPVWSTSIIQALKPKWLNSNPDSVLTFQYKSQVLYLQKVANKNNTPLRLCVLLSWWI